jgi:hypothetical protein
VLVNELFLNHRGTEDSEKNREGSLCIYTCKANTSLPVLLCALTASVVKK